jgi:hypothetical protein
MTRKCGDCQLCCKLLPVVELGKLANQKCQHQKFGVGCAIYHRCPRSCRLWSCQWLLGGDGTETLRRPDRGHYVVDIIPEFIRVQPHDGSPEAQVPVVQVWLDPRYPDAWQDAGLLAYRSGNAVAPRFRGPAPQRLTGRPRADPAAHE